MNCRPIFQCALLLFLAVSVSAQTQTRGKNDVAVRDTKQDVYYYPAVGDRLGRRILFVPGDAGWRGFAIVVAERMASWGYDVYGLDTNRYLESFSHKGDHKSLKETDVVSDFQQMADWIKQGSNERVTLVGWSEGAELTLLAAAADNKNSFDGLITFGMGKTGILGWRWVDDLTFLTKKDPHEPKFITMSYMSQVAPLPLLMIHSTHDEYVPADQAKELFGAAHEPKRFALIEAQDHKFGGNQDEFFRTLREGLEWMKKAAYGNEKQRPVVVHHG
jgi:dienelactone hydrolase